MNAITVAALWVTVFGVAVTECVAGGPSERCLCKDTANALRLKQAREISVFPATVSCPRLEILVMFKGRRLACLDPTSKQGRNVLKAKR
uniref:Chemokine interleukin-8-like domain-containing protein n=1 Tax=Denticeps clupeoides TaxID=299321 RepID=A0AAY4CCX8_9TELE